MNKQQVERKQKISDSLFKFLKPKQIKIDEVQSLVNLSADEFPLGTYTLHFKSGNNSRIANGAVLHVQRFDSGNGPGSIFYSMQSDNEILNKTSLYELDYGDNWYLVRED